MGRSKFLPIGGQIGSFGSGSYTSQSQWIQHTREAYGTAVLTWENAKHEKFRAEIEITKENFPILEKKGASEDIKFEFRQDGMCITYQYPHAQERWRMIQKIQDAFGLQTDI
ncbi:MAG: hypothetical protein IPP74_06935 [Alphaproteobacteria bacterium]|nr:hypothetical protein [Alphaproteobacteria bacterium]